MIDADSKEPSEERKKPRKSDQATGQSLIIKTESALTDNIEIMLPNYSRELPFSIPTTEIFDVFHQSSSKKHFQVIEKNSTMATAVYKERYSFKSVLLCCLTSEQRQRHVISAVRMFITVNESTCKRMVHVKAIYGYPQVLLPLINDFRTRLDTYLKSSKFQQDVLENLQNEDEDTVITCKHESSSYYQFHKILSSEGYTLGKSIADFIQAFSEQYRNPQESVSMLPIPLDSIKETVDNAVEALFSHYNFGRANSERVMVFCRPAVEKYIYSKIYPVLFAIYKEKLQKSDEKIQEIRTSCKTLTSSELFDKLDVDSEFRSDEIFLDSIETLDRVEDLKSPLEKINSYTSLIGTIKASIFDISKSTYFDDILQLKLISYLIIKSQLPSPSAELELIKDYLGLKLSDYIEIQILCQSIHFILSLNLS